MSVAIKKAVIKIEKQAHTCALLLFADHLYSARLSAPKGIYNIYTLNNTHTHTASQQRIVSSGCQTNCATKQRRAPLSRGAQPFNFSAANSRLLSHADKNEQRMHILQPKARAARENRSQSIWKRLSRNHPVDCYTVIVQGALTVCAHWPRSNAKKSPLASIHCEINAMHSFESVIILERVIAKLFLAEVVHSKIKARLYFRFYCTLNILLIHHLIL